MSSFAPILEAFFTKRLIGQRHASPNTISSYRDTFRLLVAFANKRTGKAPSALDLVGLDAGLIVAFLHHLETERHNDVRTRNARRWSRFSTRPRSLPCLPARIAPVWTGRRDHTLLLVSIQAGLRVSELTGLRWADARLSAGPHLRCHGKGRKERCTPLTSHTVSVLQTGSMRSTLRPKIWSSEASDAAG